MFEGGRREGWGERWKGRDGCVREKNIGGREEKSKSKGDEEKTKGRLG